MRCLQGPLLWRFFSAKIKHLLTCRLHVNWICSGISFWVALLSYLCSFWFQNVSTYTFPSCPRSFIMLCFHFHLVPGRFFPFFLDFFFDSLIIKLWIFYSPWVCVLTGDLFVVLSFIVLSWSDRLYRVYFNLSEFVRIIQDIFFRELYMCCWVDIYSLCLDRIICRYQLRPLVS